MWWESKSNTIFFEGSLLVITDALMHVRVKGKDCLWYTETCIFIHHKTGVRGFPSAE